MSSSSSSSEIKIPNNNTVTSNNNKNKNVNENDIEERIDTEEKEIKEKDTKEKDMHLDEELIIGPDSDDSDYEEIKSGYTTEREDEDEQDLKDTMNTIQDVLNPVKWLEKATGKTIVTDKITELTNQVGDKILKNANIATDQMFDKIEEGIAATGRTNRDDSNIDNISSSSSSTIDITDSVPKTIKRRRKKKEPEGVIGLVKKVYDRMKIIFENNFARFIYDTSRNNWLGADFDCIDQRLCGSCYIHDEVRLGTWLLLLSSIICFVVFIGVHSVLQKTQNDSLDNHPHFVSLMISLPICIVSTLLTIIQIINHHRNWSHTASQRQIVRIILMCPIYAWAAWFSLFYLSFSVYIDFIRVCYEAYVIYSFLLLLTKYLGGRDSVALIIRHKPPLEWPQPMCCLPAATPNKQFLLRIKYGVLQYVIITPILALVAGFLNWAGDYGDGEIDWYKGYPYIILIQNCSQVVSLYALVWFYVVTQHELAPFKPIGKFLVVKAVVFFTFWQSVSFAFMVKWGWITGNEEFSTGEVQVGLQNFIICIEMFITAIGHRFIFGHEDYENGSLKLIMDTRMSMWKDEKSAAHYNSLAENANNIQPHELADLKVSIENADFTVQVVEAADAVNSSSTYNSNINVNNAAFQLSAHQLLGHSPRPDDDQFEGACLVDDSMKDDEEEIVMPALKAEEILGKSILTDAEEKYNPIDPVVAFDFNSIPRKESIDPAKIDNFLASSNNLELSSNTPSTPSKSSLKKKTKSKGKH